jgi:hypothetical protein
MCLFRAVNTTRRSIPTTKANSGHDLSRDVSRRTATESQEQEPVAQKIESVRPNQEVSQPRNDQAHTIGHEIAM